MHKSQLPQQSKILFIDYEPAEVKELSGNNWRIVFRVRIPGTNKMKRYRRRVKPMSNSKERLKFAKRICANINNKLASGWSPLLDSNEKNEYVLLTTALDKYLAHNENLKSKNQLREDSKRSYASMVKNLKEYLSLKGKESMFCVEFTRSFVTIYADYVHFSKGRASRTVNNYIGWCVTFGNYLKERGYTKTNLVEGTPTYKIEKKKREIIDNDSLKALFEYLKSHNKNYLTLCLIVYYCFIRRTEITKLKVKDVSLQDGLIIIPGSSSKNKKTDCVTLNKKMQMQLASHILNAHQSDYLFSKNNFAAGPQKLEPKKISDTWVKVKNSLKLKKTYQFYSLKDTGITALFKLNIPLINIRDQARHYDIKITESYTPRNYKRDELLSNIEDQF